MIADLNVKLMAYNKCIVSTSRKTGYHIPNPLDPEDVQIVALAAKETHLKSMALLEKEKSYNNFLRSVESAKEAKQETQLTLF